MTYKPTYLKTLELANESEQLNGGFIQLDGEEYYQIECYDQLRPFFISLVSHSDHWLFISTTGGLSAGRKNAESALFPYYTDDKIRDDFEITGSKTIIRVKHEGKELIWEPFSIRFENSYRKQRNFYKNRTGNKILFEEINHDLSLKFQYSWSFSERYGFVKTSKITNLSDHEIGMEVMDGIQNILPSGVMSSLQLSASNLVNAYKKNELEIESGLGLFMLSAIIVDKAEPSEALKTTTVWSAGIESEHLLLSNLQLDEFRKGGILTTETDVRAERGAYFNHANLKLNAEEVREWVQVAEVNQDHANVIDLITQLEDKKKLLNNLHKDVIDGGEELKKLVAKADGMQLTADKLSVGRHFSNVLFNIMRGGIFDEGYEVERNDFLDYVIIINRVLAEKHESFLSELPERMEYSGLIDKVVSTGDADLIRVTYEYLPLTFSRRHGDPSRPWNKFTIAIKDENGNKLRRYEGNWRDIFQNWEALAISFPGYIISMITKFVNASTIDGYNPYRITREGIDWETIEPDNPWSYIGYWGDHQIIYLQKLLEIAEANSKEQLTGLLSTPQFVYANVPYRIKGYKEIVNNPQDTIVFDHALEQLTEKRVKQIGSDGKLVFSGSEPLKVNLTEKLLVTFLAKMSNYIPEGGIWLNTQRPEWNDANNALVGNGVSMVTLYYMRRFASSMMDLFSNGENDFTINKEVGDFFEVVFSTLKSHVHLLKGAISNKDRKIIIEALGKSGESYRTRAYEGFSNQKVSLSASDIHDFFEITLSHIDHSIRANKRADGLYHAYNLLSLNEEEAVIDHLYEMLEGQVAVLSSGLLDMKESLAVLDALKSSPIYREDQYSYMLYPNRTLPRFLEKNNIPTDFIDSSDLAATLLQEGNRSLIYKDVKGGYHFNGSFNNVESLKKALDALKSTKHKSMVEQEYQSYLDVFEQLFNHKSFTGRSGTFYGYEGLGSIYWHMVSKLLLAVQENIYWGWQTYQNTSEMGQMIDHYFEIRAGIGINKSPLLYGAVPTDPYSHTPGGRGVQQPGMTGQVKEDILNRWAELGVYVKNGCIHFDPIFLNKEEYLYDSHDFEFYNLSGDKSILSLSAGQLAFTYCQVPILYEKGTKSMIEITFKGGNMEQQDGNVLSLKLSRELFNRSGSIKKIRVINESN